MNVAAARRVARPSWVNLRTALGLLLFGTALLGGQRVLAADDSREHIWAATRDIPQDAVLTPDDVELVSVQLPAHLGGIYVDEDAALVGQVATRPVRAGELVASAWLAPTPETAAGRWMTIPVEPEHAVGGALQPGDRVDVLATFDAGNARARTVVLARAVDVLEVVETGALAFGEETVVGVTLEVGPEQASRLAFASRTGAVDVVRVDGPVEQDERAATVRSGDFP
ncbi:MAG TPA: Flp pilus assembly protein CpaB [Actinomycetota bacterium]